MELNEIWEQRIKDAGADFVYYIDASVLPADAVEGYACVVLFGKALSKEYISDLRAGRKPKRNEVILIEHKIDALVSLYRKICKIIFSPCFLDQGVFV